MEWQPIETAPKDGTPVLLWGLWAGEISGISPVPGMEAGSYSGSGDYAAKGFVWSATGGDAYGTWCKPTHWMPLPPPPPQGARMSEIELPAPAGRLTECPDGWGNHGAAGYSAEQVRAAILAERAEVERLRDVLETLAAQSSGVVGSTSRADCMAAMAAAAIRRGSV